MRFDSGRLRLPLAIFLMTGALTLAAIGSNGKAVKMIAVSKKQAIEVELKLNPTFGIQKQGPHEITVYQLSKKHTKETDVKKAIAGYGKPVLEIKPQALTGVVSKIDADYFSSVDKFTVPVSATGDLAIKAKIFYCSFKDHFCSVDVLYTILPDTNLQGR